MRTPGGGYARDKDGNYIPTPLGNILIPIFARHGFEWGARFPEEKKDQCADKVLTYFNLRDDSGKLNSYIDSRAASDFLTALQEINQAIPGGIAVSNFKQQSLV